MIVCSDQLDPHDRRFDTADDQKQERVKDIEDSQPLMVDRDGPIVKSIADAS
jgi:hypothetical protein